MKNEEYFDLLCKQGEISGGVPIELIRQAEKILNIKLPAQYIDFLSKYGAAIINGAEVYGLVSDEKNEPPIWHDIIKTTEKLRSQKQIGMENRHFIAISHDGMSTYFMMDTGYTPETAIYAVGPNVNKIVSSDFYDFFVTMSKNGIDF